jgi:hypothetical protein
VSISQAEAPEITESPCPSEKEHWQHQNLMQNCISALPVEVQHQYDVKIISLQIIE